ncbi:hypothetical protein BDV40DRAFT_313437 [Aspergillus tamarii]|uniref:Nucleoside phosphorylase domain-containing protein n=1 Tax=Aspergillus tamarii TaxID=41984 RepID=A0A5N6UQQ4_ASPTM|nr:hypothetical protein BDV40DRAFT_313437 [Aspergillus tamarii]
MTTATMNFRHQDYTVAWICALPLEMAAAEAMLDETHPKLPAKPTDDNTYILGRIYDHNIVIACLRSGVYGTTSAAALATQMQSTFQSIRFFLMVGIGGGAPSEKVDIRLGDVVVSNPTRDFGGVIQYDYGKTVSGGRFERTGVLNKPLPALLTAVSRLKAAHMSTPSKIPALLSGMRARKPMMRDNFTYRGEEQDLLFDAEYDHCGSDATCNNCDIRRLVARPGRPRYDPVIHYGLIASGNQVVKHGRTRDKLARELGILCFEMEAAGLMDDFQCLVIRGICDYSDSHKNKQWQGYAAATAAAYAKELLSVVHTTQVVDTPPALLDSKLTIRGIEGELYVQSDETLVERISNYDHKRVHRRLSQKRLVGTTQWFLDHPDFKAWFTGKNVSSLWCSGKNTALYCDFEHRSPTVYFYCENECPGTLDGSYILSSFIRQLCEFLRHISPSYPEDVIIELRKFFGHKQIQPDFEDLKDVFIRLFHYVPGTIYIIDGLDALDQKHGIPLLKFFQSLFCSVKHPQESRILLLSRDQVPGYINIATFMHGICQISTSGNVMRDIETYIETSIADKTMCRKLTDDTMLVEEIKRTLLTESSEMFLWVHLQLEVLWDTCRTDAEIRSALATLPKGLEETYGRCIGRIQERCAIKALKWVSFATRPLHIEELREAVAIDLEDTQWSAEEMTQKDTLIACCENLVVADRADGCVRFAHSSVKQYLDKCRGGNVQEKLIPEYPTPEQGDRECGELCVTYLSFSDFSLQLSKHSVERTAVAVPRPSFFLQQQFPRFFRPFSRLHQSQNCSIPVSFRTLHTTSTPDRAQYKFLDYAINNWAVQTKQILDTSIVWNKFQALATSFNETWNFHPWIPGGRSNYSHIHGLFGWAVKEQHEPLLSIALATGPALQRVCDLPLIDERLPALHVASKLGYGSIVKILLGLCNVNVPDEDGYTALHHAANKGHRVKVDAPSKSRCTPLWLAASNGHEEAVSLLTEKQSNIEAKGASSNQTPLSQATRNGHYAVTPLSLAAKDGHKAIVKLLIDKGTDLQMPLLLAAETGHEAVVQLLVDKGADQQMPLLWAAANGYKAAVNLLVDKGADLEVIDYRGQTPLSLAAKAGHEAVVKLLIDKGADLEATNSDYGPVPLLLAAENGHEAVVKLLIDKGARSRGY